MPRFDLAPSRRAAARSAPPWPAALVLCTCLLAACDKQAGSTANDARGLLRAAEASLSKHETKAAVIQLKSAIQQDPALAQARYLLGKTLLDSGDAAGALVELGKAGDLKHPPDETVPLVARAMLALGEARKLIAAHGSTQLADPGADADLKTSLASAYHAIDDKRHADELLGEALKRQPDHPPARMLKARLLSAAGQHDAAVALAALVVKQMPGNDAAWQLQGDILTQAKAPAAEALAAYRQAARLRPDAVAGHASLVSALMAQQDYAGAQEAFTAMKQALPEHRQTLYFETVLALQRKDLAAARQLADRLMGAGPSNPNHMRLAGTVALQADDLTKAATLFANALQLTPGNAVLRRLLALTQLRLAQPALALQTLQPLLDKGPADAQVLTTAAMAHGQLGDARQARALYAAAARLKPDDPRTRAALAYGRLGDADAGQAVEELQAIAASAKDPSADLALVSALVARKDFDRALKVIDELQRRQPKQPVAPMLRGQVALARGNPAGARTEFERAVALAPAYFPAYASLAQLDFRDKQPGKARQRFETLLQHDPKNAQALVVLARLADQGAASGSEVDRLLSDAVRSDPSQPGIRLLLVDHHLKANQVKQALAAAQDGLAALPGNTDLLEALGRAQLAAGDHHQALAAFNQLATLQPKSPVPQMRLAQVRLAMKDSAGAQQHLQRALAIQPGYLPALQRQVEIAVAAGQREQALSLAREVQKLRPKEATGFVTEAAVLASLKDWDGAAAAYRAALQRAPNGNELAMKLHAMLVSARQQDEADRFAAAWRKDHPKDPGFLLYLGESALLANDPVAAEAHFRAVTALAPDHAPALNNLAWLLHRQGKPGALLLAEKAHALAPDQPAYMDTLATVLADQGQVGKALALQQRAVELQPGNAMLRLSLARLYLKSGDKPQASKQLDQLAALGKGFSGQGEVAALRKLL